MVLLTGIQRTSCLETGGRDSEIFSSTGCFQKTIIQYPSGPDNEDENGDPCDVLWRTVKYHCDNTFIIIIIGLCMTIVVIFASNSMIVRFYHVGVACGVG